MSRQMWLDTSALLEAISEYVVRCNGDTFSGLTTGDFNALSNMFTQLSVSSAGYVSDPRVPLQTMSNMFVSFITSTDRCGYMLRKTWFNSDTKPTVSDDFITTYIRPRLQVPMSDTVRQLNNLSLQPSAKPKLYERQNAIMKGLDIPYSEPIEPCKLFRSVAGQTGNIPMMGILATPPAAQQQPFFVAERRRILFGIRSNAAIPAGAYQFVVPAWASVLSVTGAYVYFTNSFFGTTIAGVTATATAADAATTFTVPTDANNLPVQTDSRLSFSLGGGNINLELGVAKTGFCVAIEGEFTILANRSQAYYTLNSITQTPTSIDDFDVSDFLTTFLSQLRACGQYEIFSDAMDQLTNSLITNYMDPPALPAGLAFTSPWFRFSERARTILALQNVDLNIRKLIVRHLWVITSLIAVFGRYYRPN
uniref:Outer capsid protein P8 n=1 Tax=Rice dwarf virus (isolate Akita) TaxID=142803 RepID=P8_RDVA|nr:RecName: Full=Outer capsid protein P8; AltName: Full=Structural protein P8; Contains: RecName: Full=Outer capsid protein P8'; Contains: RecName: Full=Small peptide 1; Short=Sp1 [Rice dwarf virus (isolate Akita)]BAA01071.1 protein 8 [Rice dwarf virus]